MNRGKLRKVMILAHSGQLLTENKIKSGAARANESEMLPGSNLNITALL